MWVLYLLAAAGLFLSGFVFGLFFRTIVFLINMRKNIRRQRRDPYESNIDTQRYFQVTEEQES